MIFALIDFFSIFSGHQYLILFPDFNRSIPMECLIHFFMMFLLNVNPYGIISYMP